MRRLAAIALLLGAAVGCGGETPETIALSWRFADGRACDLAGIVDVTVAGAGPREVAHRCREGLAPDASVDLRIDAVPATIELRATTIDGALLYRGRRRVERGGPVTISMGFVGGSG